MYSDADLSVPEDVERVRRSIAMQTPGQWVLRKEDALPVLDALIEALRRAEAA